MIGIITFHWATNYGAVLQTYSLQKYLKNIGINSEIIDYKPARVRLIELYQRIINRKFDELIIEHYLRKFRYDNLNISKRSFKNSKQLSYCKDKYNTIICGSDQIWNRNFTLNAEGKITLSYFLNFANTDTKRIAYAVSFGTDSVDEVYKNAVYNEVRKFSAIGVREKTGLNIVNYLGIESKLVCDPVILLNKNEYYKFVDSNINRNTLFIFLINGSKLNDDIIIDKAIDSDKFSGIVRSTKSMESWISTINNSGFIITNSFHCTVMAILFNTPFVVLPVEGMQMNNRIQTILEQVGLTKRFLIKFDISTLKKSFEEKIDWMSVNGKLSKVRENGRGFLKENL